MMQLHGYWRSTASYRVRIALNYKRLAYEDRTYDLRAGAQRDDDYLRLNPLGLVPALEIDGALMTQSASIIEWLEDVHPLPSLLPSNPLHRATVRSMAGTIASDIHPLNNLRVLTALRANFDAEQAHIDSWIARWIGEGFASLEILIGKHGGVFAFGDSPTMADCFLVPQVYSAERFSVDLAPYPRIRAAAAAARALSAFSDAHPDRQPDADRK
jgi:maleylpyruvate isomerase